MNLGRTQISERILRNRKVIAEKFRHKKEEVEGVWLLNMEQS